MSSDQGQISKIICNISEISYTLFWYLQFFCVDSIVALLDGQNRQSPIASVQRTRVSKRGIRDVPGILRDVPDPWGYS